MRYNEFIKFSLDGGGDFNCRDIVMNPGGLSVTGEMYTRFLWSVWSTDCVVARDQTITVSAMLTQILIRPALIS